MDAKKTGALIAALRLGKGMKQEELASALGVTDKAVSRWETGRGFPDVSLLPGLAGALGVSVNDLLAGEIIPPEDTEKAESAIVDALSYMKSMGRQTASALLLAAGVLVLALPGIVIGVARPVHALLIVLGFGLLGMGLWMRKQRSRPRPRAWGRLSPAAARGASIAALCGALAVEIAPVGAVLQFGRPAGDGTIGHFRQLYSCFSLMPLGYGNFGPMLTGILTVVTLALAIAGIWKKGARDKTFVCAVVAAACSLLPLLFFGTDEYALGSGAITALLALGAVMQGFANR